MNGTNRKDRTTVPEETTRRTVYAATEGCYSDYSVIALFENREDAERFVAAGMAQNIEEMDLYSEMPALHVEYYATLQKADGHMHDGSSRTVERPKHTTRESPFWFFASGPDRERVFKSVRDRYAQWKAAGEGIA